jgi:hypothetical protein
MQTITSRDGSKRRAFCLSCLKEGRDDWIGGELCSHMLAPKKPVAPEAALDSVVSANPS